MDYSLFSSGFVGDSFDSSEGDSVLVSDVSSLFSVVGSSGFSSDGVSVASSAGVSSFVSVAGSSVEVSSFADSGSASAFFASFLALLVDWICFILSRSSFES